MNDRAKEFQIGDRVVWPNGVEGVVRGIDEEENLLMDDCGGWIDAEEVDKL